MEDKYFCSTLLEMFWVKAKRRGEVEGEKGISLVAKYGFVQSYRKTEKKGRKIVPLLLE